MKLSKILRNSFLVVLASLVLTACATKKVRTKLKAMFTLEKKQLNI